MSSTKEDGGSGRPVAASGNLKNLKNLQIGFVWAADNTSNTSNTSVAFGRSISSACYPSFSSSSASSCSLSLSLLRTRVSLLSLIGYLLFLTSVLLNIQYYLADRIDSPSQPCLPTPPPEPDVQPTRRPLHECGYSPRDFTFLAYPDFLDGLGVDWRGLNKDTLRSRYKELMLIWHPDKTRSTGLDHWQHHRVATWLTEMYEKGAKQLDIRGDYDVSELNFDDYEVVDLDALWEKIKPPEK
ncbi:hypothetical protein W97_07741 [Coniosporium apollinis CBS 100218]|uniref:J domain-containing protein n=1 Tax=Coniosporium apollinis (strain CBS 100218) TaxID=1168221 RepID=R7Z2M3_CONA1|nr:uncharacterized protein W97_07741 [Coniosporium apollinis CBS 100218]EON68417.1 hypothetical protein W97_07741 [Coniosporium apollinis CBS 100218]